MTDSRLPERYLTDRRIVRLSDSERSSYIMAALWSVSNRTDGHIERDDLPLIPTFNPASVTALTRMGLWLESDGGWVDTEFSKVQTSKSDLEVLENARRADREKKARQRAELRLEKQGRTPSFSASPGDATGDVSRGQHRTGQERKGYVMSDVVQEENTSVDEWTGGVTPSSNSWPVVAIPGSETNSTSFHIPMEVA